MQNRTTYRSTIRFDSSTTAATDYWLHVVTHPSGPNVPGTFVRGAASTQPTNAQLMRLETKGMLFAGVYCRCKKILHGAHANDTITWTSKLIYGTGGPTYETMPLLSHVVSAGDGTSPIYLGTAAALASGALGFAFANPLFMQNAMGNQAESFGFAHIAASNGARDIGAVGVIGLALKLNIQTNTPVNPNDFDIEFHLVAEGRPL